VEFLCNSWIRRALDEAESIGIRKSMEALADADLVLVVLDASQPACDEDRELLSQVEGRAAIVVENKCDLKRSQVSGVRSQVEGHGFRAQDGSLQLPKVETSALTGEGIAELRAAILEHVGGESGAQKEAGFLTNVRHQKLVTDSMIALGAAANAVAARVPHEMLLLDLYNALRPLDEITGETTTDDILNLIFGTFCIGK
jgi:tRNA modification GTPase